MGASLEPGLQTVGIGIDESLLTASQGKGKTAPEPTDAEDRRSRSAIVALRKIALTNPDVSLAVSTAKRVAMTSLDIRAYAIGPDGPTQEQDDAAGQELQRFLGRVMRSHEGGGVEAMINVGLQSLIVDGGVGFDLDIADTLDDVLDVVPVDAPEVHFRIVYDSVRRRRVVPGFINKAGTWVPANLNQFYFSGLDATVTDPHGQSWILPTIDTAPAQQQMRNTLHRVLNHQGFGRLAASVDSKAVQAMIGPSEDTAAKKRTYMKQVLQGVATRFKELEPDDAAVFYDWVTLDVLGAQQGGQGFSPGETADVYDIDTAAGAKTPPSILGRSSGTALSSNGDVHWWVYALSIEALRRYVVQAIEWVLSQYLRIRGIAAYAVITMAPIRKTDSKAEEDALQVKQARLIEARDNGLVDAGFIQVEMGYPDFTPEEPAPAAGADPEPAATRGQPVGAAGLDITMAAALEAETAWARGAVAPYEAPELQPLGWAIRAAEKFAPAVPESAGAVELSGGAWPTDDDIAAANRAWKTWARDRAPELVKLFDADLYVEPKAAARSVTRAQPVIARRWTWDARIQGYRDRDRPERVLSALALKQALERRMEDHRETILGAMDRMLADEITPRDAQVRVAESLKTVHLQARMLAVGGVVGMAFAHMAGVGALLRYDTDQLARFGQAIARGEKTAAGIRAQIAMYGQANIRREYERGRIGSMKDAGYGLERRVYGSTKDHCSGCAYEQGLGWVQIGSLAPIGGHECGPMDGCEKQFRYSAEEEFRPVDLPSMGTAALALEWIGVAA